MTKHIYLKRAAGFAVLMGVVQLVTYETLSDAAMVDAIVHLSPANCQAVCCSYYLQRDMNFDQPQQRRLDRLLRARYQSVYRNLDELPESALILDRDYRFQQVVGVCLFNWARDASGLFWFQTTFSVSHGPGDRPAVEETYVWGLFKWVRVKSIPSWWHPLVLTSTDAKAQPRVVAQHAH